MRRLTGLVLIALAACATSLDLPPAPTPGTVSGFAVDGTDSSTPLARVRVSLEGTPLTATTDANGLFLLRGVVPGRYFLDATMLNADHQPVRALRRPLAMPESAAVDVGALALVGTGEAEGRVRLAGADRGNAGTLVFVEGTRLATLTGDDGSFRLADLPEGPAILVASHDGFTPARVSTNAHAGEVVSLPALDLSRAAPAPVELRGQVAFEAPGGSASPPRTATVHLVRFDSSDEVAHVSVARDGSWSLDQVAPGVYRLVAEGSGWQTASLDGVLVQGPSLVDAPALLLTEATSGEQEPCPKGSATCFSCATDSDCGAGVCRQGSCEACSATVPCAGGLVCEVDYGQCGSCTSNADCGPSGACEDHVCVGGCGKDADCPGGFCGEGRCVACRSSGDCAAPAWCDGGVCRPPCATDGDCAEGRSCDLKTGACVTPCSQSCAAGEACDEQGTCRETCDGTFPCATGEKCVASAVGVSFCEPECATDADCASRPHTSCSGGQCVPDGSCGADSDCPLAQLCSAERCVDRPGALDPGQGYRCSTTCDCRQGEICDGAHCVADSLVDGAGTAHALVPTRFIDPSGTGDGKSAAAPTSDLGKAMSDVVSGDVVALLAGSSTTTGGPVAIAAPNVVVAGGYQRCGAERWVRDPSAKSSITDTNGGVFTIGGTGATPGVVLSNLDLVASGAGESWFSVVNASGVPGFTVTHSSITIPVPSTGDWTERGGVTVTDSPSVLLTDLDLPTLPGAFDRLGVWRLHLVRSSGTIERVHALSQVGTNSSRTVVVEDANGPITIDHVTSDADSVCYGGNGLYVACDASADSFPVSIHDNTVGFDQHTTFGNNSDGLWIGLEVVGCPDTTIENNVIDGRGQNNGDIQQPREGIHVENSSGTIAGNTVYLPSIGPAMLRAYHLVGPTADLDFHDDTASGGSGSDGLHLLEIENVTHGTVRVANAQMSSGDAWNDGVSGWPYDGIGLYAHGVDNGGAAPTLTVTDSSFLLGAAGTDPNAANISGFALASSHVLLERDRFAVGASGHDSFGGDASGSTVELYDSRLAAGDAGLSSGLHVTSGKVFAIGDDFFGGGAVTDSRVSTGVICGQGTDLSLQSSIVDGGLSGLHLMISGTGGSGCLTGGAFKDDYFFFSNPGARSTGTSGDLSEQVATVATGAPLAADQNGNLIGDHASCYDVTNADNPYALAAGAPCIDAGLAGTRQDGSAITLDLAKNPRVAGNAADIGAFERQQP